MLSSDGNENSQKNSRSNQQKNNFARAENFFFGQFFAVVLHDDNVKLPDTSELHVLWKKCCMWSCCSLFFRCRSLSPSVAASISHLLTASIKFSCYSSNEIGLLCFLPLAPALSLQTLKLSRKKESALLLLFFISKSPGGYAMYRPNARVLEM